MNFIYYSRKNEEIWSEGGKEGRKEGTHTHIHTYTLWCTIICVRPPRPQLRDCVCVFVCVCECVCVSFSRAVESVWVTSHRNTALHSSISLITTLTNFFKWLSQRVINFLSQLILEANRFHSPETDFTSISAYQRFFCLLCKCKLWNSVSAAAEHQILPLKSVQQRVQHDKCFPFFMTYWWTWFTNIVKAVTAGTGNTPHTWITSPLMPPVCW